MFIQPKPNIAKGELLLAAVAASLLIAFPGTVEAKRHGAFDGTARISKGSVLRIHNDRGDIVIREGSGDVVQVHAEVHDITDRGGLSGRYTAAEVIAYLERKPPIEQEDKEVRVGYMLDEDFHLGVEINYVINVPAWVTLEINAKHGNLEIHEVGDDIKLDKSSGSVLIQEPRGKLKVITSEGNLQVLGMPHAEWSLKSVIGDVEVIVPAGLSFELNAESSDGRLNCEFPLGEHKQGRFDGSINGGGQKIHIRTEHGAVTVRQR